MSLADRIPFVHRSRSSTGHQAYVQWSTAPFSTAISLRKYPAATWRPDTPPTGRVIGGGRHICDQ